MKKGWMLFICTGFLLLALSFCVQAASMDLPAEAQEVLDPPVLMKALDALRVRTAPTTSQNNAILMLKKDETVEVYGRTAPIEGRTWAVIRMNDTWCYVADEYLEPAQDGNEAAQSDAPEASGDAPEAQSDVSETQNDASETQEDAGDQPADEASEGAALPLDPSAQQEETPEAAAGEPENPEIPEPQEIPDPIDTSVFAVMSEAEPMGPVRQVTAVGTETVGSLTHPGKSYEFTTYSDGSVTVQVLSADGEQS